MQKGLRGTVDYWPEESAKWRFIENTIIKIMQSWGFGEVRTPIIEDEKVFLKLGADTDVVGKQMYKINNSNEIIVLRPEGTSGVLRSGLERNIINRSVQKVWYLGSMFRYERPQRGRLREFHQFGAEVFGVTSVVQEVEILDMLFNLWSKLGVADNINLEINSIGSIESRAKYKKALLEYLMPIADLLDDDSKRRLLTNPLRILDSKNEKTQELLRGCPCIDDFLSENELNRFTQLTDLLSSLGYKFLINRKLVRGLDYYNDLVFEFTTSELGSQSAICAGGRFDTLSKSFGGEDIPALGFSIGMERLIELFDLQSANYLPVNNKIIAFTTDDNYCKFFKLLNEIREISNFDISVDYSSANFNNKYKRALKSDPLAVLTIENNECVLRLPNVKPIKLAWDAREIICQINKK